MLFSKGIGLGFNTQDFAAELRGIKPFATNKFKEATIKIIVMDLDDTLLNSDKEITPYTLEQLEKCRAEGALIVIDTARNDGSSKRIIDVLKPDYAILSGGAMIRDKAGEIIYRNMMPAETVRGIVQTCLDSGLVRGISMRTENHFYKNYKNLRPHPDFDWGEQYDFSIPIEDDAYNMSLEISDAALAETITKRYTSCTMYHFEGEDWHSVYRKGVSKLQGIREIAATNCCNLSQIVAFGDSLHDRDMIVHCGIGVAMGNASNELKAAADAVCESNDEDGIGKWLAANYSGAANFSGGANYSGRM
jgi:Cof subfamily protein (haloacid dehalogenase superfamily)